MTPDLKKMVEAMWAEFQRQAKGEVKYVHDLDAEGREIAADNGTPYTWGPQGVILDGSFDLEAVARAALEAIREPSEAMVAAGERVECEASAGFTAMIEEILK